MKRKVFLFVALIMVVAIFAACGPANSVNGLWYDKAGLTGTMEFKSGGVVTMTMMGMPFDGKYTFDAAKSTGTITLSLGDQEQTTDFTLKDGLIDVDGQTYTREKVEQKDLSDALSGLEGALGN